MGIHELIITRDLMLKTGPEHFDMGQWFHSKESPVTTIHNMTPDLLETINHCHTTACFAGFGRLAAFTEGMDQILSALEIADWLGVDAMVFQPSEWQTSLEDRQRVDPYCWNTPDLEYLHERWVANTKDIEATYYPEPTGHYDTDQRAVGDYYAACELEHEQRQEAEFQAVIDYINWKIDQTAAVPA
jgi:hypothetical protein